MEFTRTIYIGDVEFSIIFEVGPDGKVEIIDATIGDQDVLSLLKDSVCDTLHRRASDMVADCLAEFDESAKADAAEARRAE